eukprot:TRINITY_DN2334_c0_g1_i1.p1 TRINITY_DN2334_c0_g1~~TRINITY_DN2334_c0_g1_i1.p1  ORF type:complete len:270 (+),score=63.38 TRINITY_DN2334_c0_g1_i1:53-811(+)
MAGSPLALGPFGLLQPGHAPRCDWQQTQEGKWMIQLQPLLTDQVVVFLTGVQPIPEDHGLGVYITRQADNCFEYMGSLRNDRASALFRIPLSLSPAGVAEAAACAAAEHGQQPDVVAAVAASAAASSAQHPLVLGVSLEPLPTLENLDGGSRSAGPMAAPGWAGATLQGGTGLREQRGDSVDTGKVTWQRGALRLANDLAQWLGSFIKEDEAARSFLVVPIDFAQRWLQRVHGKLQGQPNWLDSAARIEQAE